MGLSYISRNLIIIGIFILWIKFWYSFNSVFGINEIDFNQAIDCRLFTDEIADLIQGLPITPLRFAFDGLHEDGFFQRAIEKVAKRGFWQIVNYVLYNFNDTPEDFYYRIRITRKEAKEAYYWLELLHEATPEFQKTINQLLTEALELKKIFSSIADKV